MLEKIRFGSQIEKKFLEDLEFLIEFNRFLEKFSKEILEIRHYNLVGEGQAAKVFDLSQSWNGRPLCVKIFHKFLTEISLLEYKRRQSASPKEEFFIQDKLFNEGFPVPEPFYMDTEDSQPYIVMEKIMGYDLRQINERGGLIKEPLWSDLERLVIKMNNKHKIVHRDLHPGNIILQTDGKMDWEMKGKLYVIDFGTSRRTFSDNPSEEDFKLTVGDNVIKYPMDHSNIGTLRPRVGGNNVFLS